MHESNLQTAPDPWTSSESELRCRAPLACSVALGILLLSTTAAAQIKQPGSHVRYSAEIEPHLVIQWDGPQGFDEGLGLGLRASIPLFHNGPITKINNNMAIGFGFDWAFFDERCRSNYYAGGVVFYGADCSGSDLWLPVVLQWNFYLTPNIAVFGEPGFAIRHTRVSFEPCPTGEPYRYDCDYSDTDFLNLVFYAGGKFFVSESVAVTVRLGFPSISVGASFFL
jgi:hypothetical protein